MSRWKRRKDYENVQLENIIFASTNCTSGWIIKCSISRLCFCRCQHSKDEIISIKAPLVLCGVYGFGGLRMMKVFCTRLRIKTNPIIKLMFRAVQIAFYDVYDDNGITSLYSRSVLNCAVELPLRIITRIPRMHTLSTSPIASDRKISSKTTKRRHNFPLSIPK